MSDLRDGIHKAPLSADEQTFLRYHDDSPWAQAKVSAGLRLNPEAVTYMLRELDERARAKAEYEAKLKAEKDEANGPEPAPETSPLDPVAGRSDGAAGVRGPERVAEENR